MWNILMTVTAPRSAGSSTVVGRDTTQMKSVWGLMTTAKAGWQHVKKHKTYKEVIDEGRFPVRPVEKPLGLHSVAPEFLFPAEGDLELLR